MCTRQAPQPPEQQENGSAMPAFKAASSRVSPGRSVIVFSPPARIGVFANQPNPLIERHRGVCRLFWKLALAATLGEDDALTSPLLPDFSLPLARLFALPPELAALLMET